jgi:hypothetical protein
MDVVVIVIVIGKESDRHRKETAALPSGPPAEPHRRSLSTAHAFCFRYHQRLHSSPFRCYGCIVIRPSRRAASRPASLLTVASSPGSSTKNQHSSTLEAQASSILQVNPLRHRYCRLCAWMQCTYLTHHDRRLFIVVFSPPFLYS